MSTLDNNNNKTRALLYISRVCVWGQKDGERNVNLSIFSGARQKGNTNRMDKRSTTATFDTWSNSSSSISSALMEVVVTVVDNSCHTS